MSDPEPQPPLRSRTIHNERNFRSRSSFAQETSRDNPGSSSATSSHWRLNGAAGCSESPVLKSRPKASTDRLKSSVPNGECLTVIPVTILKKPCCLFVMPRPGRKALPHCACQVETERHLVTACPCFDKLVLKSPSSPLRTPRPPVGFSKGSTKTVRSVRSCDGAAPHCEGFGAPTVKLPHSPPDHIWFGPSR